MDLVAHAQSIVRATPAEVFDAFVNPEKMKQFWFQRTDSGLTVGETVTWYIGEGDDAFGFAVEVIDLQPNTLIHVRWGDDQGSTEIRWTLEETEMHDTVLTIEESGFTGSDADIIDRALDSTGGFNQVLVAAKALVEHGVAINVVSDHA